MADELQVEPARLREAARFISDKAQVIRERVQELDRSVGQELLADGWRGSAASAYDESWLEWKHGAEEIVAALEQSATSLADTANLYEAQESANRDSITHAGKQV
ncbi:WXG100 family type VII secretion target [Nocardia sp. CDC159]|uniref:ESAT-6-like protein n=1 Tax=Nocardia pulmonis TaxID=2951408 RepID=A0A9X2E6D7_9NOCA|nr:MULTISPECIES: WXG100 family type VII secretion target [Nocardia]MCM6774486.1 WXG100 family type VII secretion target [Nocardia pulmonis]MCM6787448.1 WXG100 family type VII secretion target [Nocardia sp. CDC159]